MPHPKWPWEPCGHFEFWLKTYFAIVVSIIFVIFEGKSSFFIFLYNWLNLPRSAKFSLSSYILFKWQHGRHILSLRVPQGGWIHHRSLLVALVLGLRHPGYIGIYIWVWLINAISAGRSEVKFDITSGALPVWTHMDLEGLSILNCRIVPPA